MSTRADLSKAKRIVIKIGTHVLVNKLGRPDRRKIQRLVEDISALQHQGKEVLVVSSGAIAAGLQALKIKRRPNNLPALQMAASVGQTRLLTYYHEYFTPNKIIISQVLLTHDDLKNRTRHLNARNTLLALLKNRVLPIINENDVVSVDEIKFGDNDILSALVATLVEADCLILLTTPNGLQQTTPTGRQQRVSSLSGITADVWSWIKPSPVSFSTGGMESKLRAAQIALKNGCEVVIAPGKQAHVCTRVMAGDDIGTHISPTSKTKQTKARKRWIAFFHKPQGKIFVDQGAALAMSESGKSLLPIGIKAVEGHFNKGALVDIMDEEGNCIARGLSDYNSVNIDKIKGCRSSQIAEILGTRDYEEVIHRDNLWLLTEGD